MAVGELLALARPAGLLGARVPRLAREASVIYVRSLKKVLRIRLLLFMSLLQPLLWLVLFSQIFSRMVDFLPPAQFPYRSYLQFFVPAAIAMTVLGSAFQSGMGMVTDIEQGMLDKFLIAPIYRSSILVGKILADGTRMVAQAAVIVVVGYAMGLRVRTGAPGVLLILLLAGAFGLAWTGISNTVALRTQNAETTMMLGIMLTFPITFLSTSFMPKPFLPSWLSSVSTVNPLTYFVDASRALVNTGYDWALYGRAAGAVAALGAVTLTSAVRAFRRVTG